MSDCCFTLFAAILGAFIAGRFVDIVFAKRRANILRRRARRWRDRAARNKVRP